MKNYCRIKKMTVSIIAAVAMLLNTVVIATAQTAEFVSNVTLNSDYLSLSGKSAEGKEKIDVFLLNEGKTVKDLNAAVTNDLFEATVNYCNVIQSDSNGNFSETFQINSIEEDKQYLLYVQGETQSYTQYIGQKQYIYVSKKGSDTTGDGTAEKPFATITKARDYLRGKDRNAPVEVIIGEGVYNISETIVFGAEDTGTEEFPITYKACEPGKVVFEGTSNIDISKVTGVTDESIRSRLQDGVADKLVQIDLKEQEIPEKVVDFLAKHTPGVSGKAIGVYLNDKPQSISRWPNAGYETISEVVSAGGSASAGTTGGGTVKISGLDSERTARWASAANMYVEGYLGNDWHSEWAKVGSVDADNLTVTLDTYTHYGLAKDMRIAAVNLPEEIDVPGEWYADADTMTMYYYPPHTLTSKDELEIATLCGNFITIDNASYINIEGIEFAKNADSPQYTITNANGGHGIALFSGASNIKISNCILRDIGMDGIITYADNVDINGCIIYNTGWSGITVSGGDRMTLKSGNVRISDSIITGVNRDTGSNLIAGIGISGVGTVVENNILFNIPNSAVRYSGNNHIIRNNEIYNCVNKTADAGAIYAGRSWTNYGTNIINNYFHDIGAGITTSYQASAVFWDDNHSGNSFVGNIVNMNNQIKTLGVKIGGGRDNTVAANIIVNSAGGIGGEDRDVNPPLIYNEDDASNFYNMTQFQTFAEAANNVTNAYNITDDDWITEYKNSYPTIMENFKLLKYLKTYKRVETIRSNAIYNCNTAMGLGTQMTKDSTVSGNVTVSQEDFVDALNGDYRIKSSVKATLGLADEVPDENFDMNGIGLQNECTSTSEIAAFDLMYPANNSSISGSQTVLRWSPSPLADSYSYEVASDSNFNNIVASGDTIYNIVEVSGLEQDKEYFWRVTAVNESRQLGGQYVCGNVFRFTTSGELLFENIEYNKLLNTIKFSVANTKATSESFIVIVALKTADGKLTAIRSSNPITLSANASNNYTISTAFEDNAVDTASIVEFYAWDSLNNMRSIIDKKSFNK